MKLNAFILVTLLGSITSVWADEPQSKFRLVKNTGWNVCHAVLNRLESLQPPDDKIGCEIPLDPKSKHQTLREPAWEELSIEEHWDTVYAMETFMGVMMRGGQRVWKDCVGCQSLMGRPDSELKIPPMEDWRGFYAANMRSGVVKPRLRRARVHFASDGPEEILLAYTPKRHNIERCKEQMARDELPYETGEYIFPLDPDSGKLTFIYPATGSGGSSAVNDFLITHRGNAYLAWLSVVNRTITISRVYRGPKLVAGRDLHYFEQQICEIVGLKPLQITK